MNYCQADISSYKQLVKSAKKDTQQVAYYEIKLWTQ